MEEKEGLGFLVGVLLWKKAGKGQEVKIRGRGSGHVVRTVSDLEGIFC